MPFTAAIFQPSFKWFKRTYPRLSRGCPVQQRRTSAPSLRAWLCRNLPLHRIWHLQGPGPFLNPRQHGRGADLPGRCGGDLAFATTFSDPRIKGLEKHNRLNPRIISQMWIQTTRHRRDRAAPGLAQERLTGTATRAGGSPVTRPGAVGHAAGRRGRAFGGWTRHAMGGLQGDQRRGKGAAERSGEEGAWGNGDAEMKGAGCWRASAGPAQPFCSLLHPISTHFPGGGLCCVHVEVQVPAAGVRPRVTGRALAASDSSHVSLVTKDQAGPAGEQVRGWGGRYASAPERDNQSVQANC